MYPTLMLLLDDNRSPPTHPTRVACTTLHVLFWALRGDGKICSKAGVGSRPRLVGLKVGSTVSFTALRRFY